MSFFFISLLILALLLILWGVGVYNRLIRLKNQVKNAWSQIDVQLQRRYDLIPNLVETVKGYMNYEKQTLEAVIQARNNAEKARGQLTSSDTLAAQPMKDLAGAEMALKGGLTHIFALAESYPDLKASANMQKLQEELSTTENKISFARQAYNDSAMLYNSYQQQFPAVILAKRYGHQPAGLWEVTDEAAKKSVKVSF